MLLRRFRRHFGVSSRKVAVQAHLAWYWRWTIVVLSVGILAGSVWYAYRFSQGFTAVGREDLVESVGEMQVQMQALEQDNVRLRADLAASDNRLKIESGMRMDMTRQLKSLSEEASIAKDEAAVLKAMLTQAGRMPGVSISRLRIQRDGAEFRYRFTLVHNAAGGREFEGQLRMVANLVQDGKAVTMALPRADADAVPSTALSFKLFQPVEGSFQIPGNATLRSLEVRVFENGSAQPRATQTALPS